MKSNISKINFIIKDKYETLKVLYENMGEYFP